MFSAAQTTEHHIHSPTSRTYVLHLLAKDWLEAYGRNMSETEILQAVADARHHHPLTVLCSVPILGPSSSSATLSFFFFLFRVLLSLIYPHPKLSHVSFC